MATETFEKLSQNYLALVLGNSKLFLLI